MCIDEIFQLLAKVWNSTEPRRRHAERSSDEVFPFHALSSSLSLSLFFLSLLRLFIIHRAFSVSQYTLSMCLFIPIMYIMYNIYIYITCIYVFFVSFTCTYLYMYTIRMYAVCIYFYVSYLYIYICIDK